MCSVKCCANLEVLLLFRYERFCSLYLVTKFCLFVLCTPSCSRNMSVCILRRVRIYLRFGCYELNSSVGCLYGRLLFVR
jgi:hypothetical protein